MALKRSTLSSGGSSTSVLNDFTIMTEANGHSRIDLTKVFPAGTYVITSKLLDTSYDVYLIAEDGTNAGYLAASSYIQMTITASKAFNKVVLYGATNNDVLAFEYRSVFSATGASTSEFAGAAARAISINTSDLPNQNNTTTITGQNFASDVAVTFTGTDSVARSAKSISRTNSTTLVVTRPDDMPTTYSPYTITVSNPGITAPTSSNLHKLTNSITVGNAPVWVTSAILTAYKKDQAYSQSIQATDSDGGSSITYSIVSGALPSGITFNTSTGTFSGTPTTNASSPYTYTIRATDAGANFVDRAFTVQQLVPDAPTAPAGTDIGTSRAYNNGAVSVAFTPATTGPAATSYTATAYLAGVATAFATTGASSPLTVAGLASNTGYTFVLTASNASGTSLLSTASSSVTATTVPQAPTIGTMSLSGTTASVPVTANATGGKAITSFAALSNIGSFTGSSATSPVSVASLGFGNTYTFTATATNANGTSTSSSASNSLLLSFPSSDADNFNRTTVTALGNTSTNNMAWSNLTGTWFSNGSQAQSNNSFATTIVTTPTSFGTVQAGTVTPGVGLVYWATDANNLVASYPFYSTSSSSVCGAAQASCSGQGCTPSGCCGAITYYCSRTCGSICGPISGEAYGIGNCPSCAQILADWGGGCSASGGTSTFHGAVCSANGTVTTSRAYIRTYSMTSGSASVVDDYETSNSTSSVTTLNSMRAVTNNSSSVTISAWTGTGFSGTLYTRSLNPGSSRSTGYGLIKNTSGSATGASQGSVADDFAVSGF